VSQTPRQAARVLQYLHTSMPTTLEWGGGARGGGGAAERACANPCMHAQAFRTVHSPLMQPFAPHCPYCTSVVLPLTSAGGWRWWGGVRGLHGAQCAQNGLRCTRPTVLRSCSHGLDHVLGYRCRVAAEQSRMLRVRSSGATVQPCQLRLCAHHIALNTCKGCVWPACMAPKQRAPAKERVWCMCKLCYAANSRSATSDNRWTFIKTLSPITACKHCRQHGSSFGFPCWTPSAAGFPEEPAAPSRSPSPSIARSSQRRRPNTPPGGPSDGEVGWGGGGAGCMHAVDKRGAEHCGLVPPMAHHGCTHTRAK